MPSQRLIAAPKLRRSRLGPGSTVSMKPTLSTKRSSKSNHALPTSVDTRLPTVNKPRPAIITRLGPSRSAIMPPTMPIVTEAICNAEIR